MASLGDDPEQVGVEVRKILGIDYEQQINWNAGYESFNRWWSVFERAGVLVSQATAGVWRSATFGRRFCGSL